MKKKIFAVCAILVIMGAMVVNCFAAGSYDTFFDSGDDYNPFNYSAPPNSFDIIIDRSRIAEILTASNNLQELMIMTTDGTTVWAIIVGNNLTNNVGITNCNTIIQTANKTDYWSIDYAYSTSDTNEKYIRLSNVYQPLYFETYYDSTYSCYVPDEYVPFPSYDQLISYDLDLQAFDKVIQIWNREQYGLQERWWNENNTGEAYNTGYNNGYTTGLNTGYNQGYSAGLETADNGSFSQLVGATIQTPVNVLRSILNFEFLGVNLFAVFTSLLTIALFIAVIKTVI